MKIKKTKLADLLNKPFEHYNENVDQSPILLNSPHSGRYYYDEFMQSCILNFPDIRSSEDCFVDLLIEKTIANGYEVICANFPRAVLDINRSVYDLDKNMFIDDIIAEYKDKANNRLLAKRGLGIIPKIVSENKPIYNNKMHFSEALLRISKLYFPHHDLLENRLNAKLQANNIAFLIDVHSMPSKNLNKTHTNTDFVIGDCFSNSCNAEFSNLIIDFLHSKNYKVVRNDPYSGGYITKHYGKPKKNIHAIQIEISRALYMDEENFTANDGFNKIQDLLFSLTHHLNSYINSNYLHLKAAQ